MCSRYSCSSVHSSPTGLHVGFALQRQQGGEGGGWLGGSGGGGGGRGGEGDGGVGGDGGDGGGGDTDTVSWLSLRFELTPPSADTLAEPWRPTPLLAGSSGGACCSRRVLLKWLPRPAAPKASVYWLLSGRAPKARSVAPTSKSFPGRHAVARKPRDAASQQFHTLTYCHLLQRNISFDRGGRQYRPGETYR
mgnify:CR=1 FL=1